MNRLICLLLLLSAPAFGRIDVEPDPGLPDLQAEAPDTAWRDVVEADCPVFPTAALCLDPAWQASACGARDRRRDAPLCSRALRPVQALATAAQPVRPMLTVAHDDVDGPFQAYDAQAVTLSGGSGGTTRALVGPWARATVDGAPIDAETRARNQRWHDNCAVTSCEEYLREKFYDYAAFEDRIAALGDDWRAIFEAAYEAEGISGAGLRRFNGRLIGDIELPSREFYQNDYFAHRPWREERLPWASMVALAVFPDVEPDFLAVNAGCRFDVPRQVWDCGPDLDADGRRQLAALNRYLAPLPAAINEALRLEPGGGPPAGVDRWAWHRQQSDALAGFSDERLLWLDDAQALFVERRGERARLQREIRALTELLGFVMNDQTDAGDQVRAQYAEPFRAQLRGLARQLHAVEEAIVADLTFALEQGCLADGLTPCDWSPRWPAMALRAQFTRARAESLATCQALTANNFSWLHHPPDGPNWLSEQPEFCDGQRGCVLRDTYVNDTVSVEQYFSTVQRWLEALDFPRDPETNRVIVTRSASDALRVGDRRFNVTFDFDAAWRLDQLDQADPCAARVVATNGLGVDATAFGLRAGRLFGGDALVRADVTTPPPNLGPRPDGARADAVVDLEMFGNSMYQGESWNGRRLAGTYSGARYSFYFSKSPDWSRSHQEAGQAVVGVVPVVYEGGIAGKAALNLSLERQGWRCEADAPEFAGRDTLESRIEPVLSATAFAEAGVGVPGASFGVRGDVTLLRLGLPLTVIGGYTPEAGGTLDLRMRAEQTLTVLRGSVSLVLEFVFATYTRRLFSWQGPRWSNTLIDDHLFGPLLVLINAFGEGEARARQAADFDPGLTCDVPEAVPEPTVYFDFDDAHTDRQGNQLTAARGEATLDWTLGVQPGRPDGVHGQAYALDGADLSFAGADRQFSSFTYALWFRPEIQAGTLLDLGDLDNRSGLRVRLHGDHQLTWRLRCGDTTPSGLMAGEFSLAEGTWNHLAVTHDATEDVVRVYVDGGLQATRRGCDLGHTGWTRHLARTVDGDDLFVGDLDDFAWWDGVALDWRHVREIARRGEAGRPVSGAGAARPTGVTALAAEPFDDRVRLTWQRPPDLGDGAFEVVEIRGSRDRYPTGLGFGERIYRGAAAEAVHRGLEPGQIWYYAAFAVTPEGLGTRGPVAYARTVDAPPMPVADFVAQGNAGHVNLSWRLPDAADVARVVVRRHPTRAPGLAEGVVVYRGRASGVTDAGLAAGPWFYSAHVYDWFGNASAPATAHADVFAVGDVVVGPPPRAVAVQAEVGDATVRLTWRSDGPDPAGWLVTRAELDGWRTDALRTVAPRYTDVGLVNDRAYQYVIRAVDRFGRRGAPAVVLATPTAGDVPQPLRDLVAEGLEGQVVLRWTDPADPTARVVVRRSTLVAPDRPGAGLGVFDGRGAQLVDADVTPERTYHYSAFVVDRRGAVSPPARISARPTAADDEAPPPVLGLEATPGPASVRLVWTLPPSDDLAQVEVEATPPGAVIYRGLGRHTVHAGAPGVAHTFRITTVDSAGNRGAPVVVEATPLDRPGPVADAGAPQAGVGGTWRWLDGSASQAGAGARFTWTQVAGPTAPLIPAGRTDARVLVPAVDAELEFRLEVRDEAGVAEAHTTITVGGAAPALPPAVDHDVAVAPFEISLKATAEVLVAHEPQSAAVHVLDPDTGALRATVDLAAGAFVFLDGDRAGLLGEGDQLHGIDLSDPDAPRLVAPLPLSFRFGGRIAADAGRVVAYNPADGGLRVAAQTPEGWAVQFDTTVPGDRAVRRIVVQGEVAYLALARTPELPEAVLTLELTGDAPAWGAPVALPDHTVFELAIQPGRLAALALPVAGGPLRVATFDLADPRAPAAPVLLAGDFAQPDIWQGVSLVGDRLFAVGLRRPNAVEVITLGAERAEPGPAFSSPRGAGSFALWPPAAPQALWVPAEGSGAAPGVMRRHALDALASPWWPRDDAHPVTAVADGAGLVLAAGPEGLGTWRRVDGAVAAQAWLDWAEPVVAPRAAVVLPGVGAVALDDGQGGARLARVTIGAEGELNPGGELALPGPVSRIWPLDAEHALLDLQPFGLQVVDLSGAPAAVGPLFGDTVPDNFNTGELSAYDSARREAVVVMMDGGWQRWDLSDPTQPVARDFGYLEPPEFPGMPPMFFLVGDAPMASLSDGVLHVINDGLRRDYPLDAGEAARPAVQLPAPAPARLEVHAAQGVWALVAGGALRWATWPEARPQGRVMLPAGPPPAEAAGAAYPTDDGGPYGIAVGADGVLWLAAGPSGLHAIDLAPPRLRGPDQAPVAGEVARWTVAWAPAAGLAPACTVSSGDCALEAADLAAGTATLRWALADPGPATLQFTVAHAGGFRSAQTRVRVEAP